MIMRILLAVTLVAAFAACGSDSLPGTQTGLLVDSPVANMGYRTETLEGVTNAQGEYVFRPGETVTFFIGALEFPPVAATGVVTPLELAGSDDVADPTVINMIRLLQTLDQNGDPDDGITITEAAKQAATAVDFDQPVLGFAADPAVTGLVSNGGQDDPVVALVEEGAAREHFEDQLEELESIVGTWVATTGPAQLLVVAVFDDGTYLHAEVESGEPLSGMEWGEYDHDEMSGRLVVSTIFDNNGDLGLSDFMEESVSEFYVDAFGNTMTASIDDDGDEMIDDTITFERVSDVGILGTWRAVENDNELLALIFLDDGTYVHAEVDRQDQDEMSGMEWGDYTRNADGGQITASQRFDNNGDTGLTEFSSVSMAPFMFANVVEETLELDIDENGNEEVDETIYFLRSLSVMVPR